VALVPLLHSTAGLAFWQLLVLVFLGAFIDMPGATARQSMLPSLADRARMPKERANSAFIAVQRVCDTLGPPIGGVLVALIGATGVLWINACTFAVSAAAIMLGVPALRLGSGPQSQGRLRGYIAELREGLSFIRRERMVRTITAAAVAFNFLAVPLLTVVVAVYAQRNFGNASSLGFMLGAFAGGVLLSSVLFGIFGHRLPRRTIFSLAAVAQWLPVWALVFSPPLLGQRRIAGRGGTRPRSHRPAHLHPHPRADAEEATRKGQRRFPGAGDRCRTPGCYARRMGARRLHAQASAYCDRLRAAHRLPHLGVYASAPRDGRDQGTLNFREGLALRAQFPRRPLPGNTVNKGES
jgi:hypothetical protein